MKTRGYCGRKLLIAILIGLFSILFATESLAEENTWYFPHIKTGQGWKTTLFITNIEDKNAELKILLYDENGNFLGEGSGNINLKVGEIREINGETIPFIKYTARQLDFPTLALDDLSSTEESTSTETHQTIFNEDKDIWGWFSGTYIVLYWNPYNFSTFRVYRQTNGNTQWKLVSREPLKKPEYFDSDLDKFREISFKVEAVTEEGAILKSYTPILFQLDRWRQS